jgi:small subunit ribosomal protein S6
MSKRRCNPMPNLTNSYETVLILSTNLGEEGTTAMIQKFKDLIEANGTIESVDEWGKRRLAHPIAKQPEGYYTLINFKSSPEFTAELDRVYKITDGVLRSLIIKKEIKPAKTAKPAKQVEAETVAEA